MGEIKTQPTEQSVSDFINNVEPEQKRLDSYELMEMMEQITGEKPRLWGPSIIGFGKYHYKYDSGHEGDMCIAGFSPRNANIVIYLNPGFSNSKQLLSKLGKFKTSVVCLYISKLSDIDKNILKELIVNSIKEVNKLYPS